MLGDLRLRRSVRGADVFLVTYPKSGTNWVGYFLASIVADRETGAYDSINLATYRKWVPDINRTYSAGEGLSEYAGLSDPRIFTVHTTYEPAFPRVIHLVRDPRAVMASYYWHRRREKSEFDMSIEQFVQRPDAWPGDWADHVSGWLNNDSERLLTVRYEDLQEEPSRHFRRIVEFVGLEPPDDLEKYIEHASFERMAEAEPGREEKDIPFIRRGQTSSWREELPGESIRLIEDRYEDLMRRLGYQKEYA